MFGFSHLPFSTLFTPVFNGEIDSFEMFIDQGTSLDFDIKQTTGFNLDIKQQSLSELYIEEEEVVGFKIQKSPGVIL
jgi:hypothetical protein